MALDIRAVRFLTPTSTGTQNITISGFGTPKAAMFIMSYSNAANEVRDGAYLGVGVTDGTNNWFFGGSSEHNQAKSDSTRVGSYTSCVVTMLEAGISIDGEADWNAWVTDGVQIDWTDAPSEAMYGICILFGGSDIDDVTAGIGTAHATVDTAVTITTNHANDLIFFGCVGDTSARAFTNQIFSFGVGIDDGSDTQRVMGLCEPDNSGASDAAQDSRNDSVLGQFHQGNWTWRGELDNITSTAFDIITRVAGSGSDDFGYLSFDLSAGVSKSLTTQSSPTDTGSESVSGIGFEPSALILIGGAHITENTPVGAGNRYSGNISIINSSEQFSTGIQDWSQADPTDTQSVCDDVAMNWPDRDGSALLAAAFTSFDSGGWTLTYSEADATARVMIALALASGVGDSTLTVNDVSYAMAFDAPVLKQRHNLIVNDLGYTYSLDAAPITQFHELVNVGDLDYAQTLDTALLSQIHNLNAADLAYTYGIDAVVIEQIHNLIVNDLLYAYSLDGVNLGGVADTALIVADMAYTYGINAVILEQIHNLIAADLDYAQSLDSAGTLSQLHNLNVADLTYAHSIDSVTLSQLHNLVVNDLAYAYSINAVSLAGATTLVVDDLSYAQTIDGVNLVQAHVLTVNDLGYIQSLDSILLNQNHLLQVRDLLYSYGLDSVSFAPGAVGMLKISYRDGGMVISVTAQEQPRMTVEARPPTITVTN